MEADILIKEWILAIINPLHTCNARSDFVCLYMCARNSIHGPYEEV